MEEIWAVKSSFNGHDYFTGQFLSFPVRSALITTLKNFPSRNGSATIPLDNSSMKTNAFEPPQTQCSSFAHPLPPPLAGLRGVTVNPPDALGEILLRRLESHLANVDRPYFTDPRLQLLELSAPIGRLRGYSAFKELANDLISFSTTSRHTASVITNTAPHLLALLPFTGKTVIISLALQNRSKSARKHVTYAAVRSCMTRDELTRLLTPERSKKLLALKYKPLTEIIGKVETLRTLKHVAFPAILGEKKSGLNNAFERQLAKHQIIALRDITSHALARLDGLFQPTPAAQSRAAAHQPPSRPKAVIDAQTSLSLISRRADKLLTGPRPSLQQMNRFITTASRQIHLECSEGVRLSQSYTLPEKDLWTPRRVQQLLEALSFIPEGHRIMEPKLRDFHFAKLNDLGERRPSGRIALGVPGVFRHNQKNQFGGLSHMVGVSIHEVGHSIQMGSEEALLRWCAKSGEIWSPTNPLFDIAIFASLSDWRIVGRIPKKEVIGEDSFMLGGKTIPLNRAVLMAPDDNIPGHTRDSLPEWIVFRYAPRDNVLYRHTATASFARSSNSTTDPFEDWAESFTDYFISPDQLLTLAPQKFYYMELLFKRYILANDHARLSALHRALRDQPKHPSLGAHYPVLAGQPNTNPEQQLFNFMVQQTD